MNNKIIQPPISLYLALLPENVKTIEGDTIDRNSEHSQWKQGDCKNGQKVDRIHRQKRAPSLFHCADIPFFISFVTID